MGDTEEELATNRRSVKQQIAFYASTRTYEPVLAAHGWQDLTPALHRKSVEGDWPGERPPLGEVPQRMHAFLVRQNRFGQPRDACRRESSPRRPSGRTRCSST